MEDFYGSIKEELFREAIEWAEQFVDISDEEKDILIQTKKSTLFHDSDPWRKKGEGSFDVTTGSNDGAETCELIGLYLLSQLQDLGIDIGLYRDDGLAVCKFSPRKVEQIKKKICEIFKKNQLSITISANLKVVDFLDVTLNLTLGTYKPYCKPNSKPLYVNKKSNHPPGVINNIAEGVNKRLNEISSNKELFDEAAPFYQKSLNEAGYSFKLEFTPKTNHQETENSKQKRKRKQNITWFNPP